MLVKHRKYALRINGKIEEIYDREGSAHLAAKVEQERLAGEGKAVTEMEVYGLDMEITFAENVKLSERDFKSALRMALQGMEKKVSKLVVRIKEKDEKIETENATANVVEVTVENAEDSGMSQTFIVLKTAKKSRVMRQRGIRRHTG